MLIAASRVWLGYHTWQQVAAGTIFGVVFASLWFTLWTNGMDKHAMLLEQSVTKLLQQELESRDSTSRRVTRDITLM